jgi:hypothetical protein
MDGRLDLASIEQCLRALQADMDRVNRALTVPREPLVEDMIRNMIDGYAYVDDVVRGGIDALAPGNAHVFLELNARVLCGTDPAERVALAEHLEATEERFYSQQGGGIEVVIEWLKRHRKDAVEKQAAGAFVEVMSEPQLFIEGNNRTGALMMSYLLARQRRPPFVLSPSNAISFFTIAAAITRRRRNGWSMLFAAPRLRRDVGLLLGLPPECAGVSDPPDCTPHWAMIRPNHGRVPR